MKNELLTLIVSGTTGIIGYGVREWQNHLHPFISLKRFNSDYFLNDLQVEIKEDISKKLASTFYISNLEMITTLGEVFETKEECINVINDTPNIVQAIDELKKVIQNKESDDNLFKKLSKLFSIGYIDMYLLSMSVNGKIKIPPISQSDKSVFTLTESTQYDGCYILSHNGEPVTIGMNFNDDQFYKEIFKPIAELLIRANRSKILKVFEAFQNELQIELNNANSVISELENIVDENSQWEAQLHIANLKRTPILIDSVADLYVKDKTGASFCEKCLLVLDYEDAEGNIRKLQSDSPIVISSGENISFSFFTKKTQKEMDRGKDFRNAFNHGQAKAWLILTVKGVGLIKKRKYSTAKLLFKE